MSAPASSSSSSRERYLAVAKGYAEREGPKFAAVAVAKKRQEETEAAEGLDARALATALADLLLPVVPDQGATWTQSMFRMRTAFQVLLQEYGHTPALVDCLWPAIIQMRLNRRSHIIRWLFRYTESVNNTTTQAMWAHILSPPRFRQLIELQRADGLAVNTWFVVAQAMMVSAAEVFGRENVRTNVAWILEQLGDTPPPVSEYTEVQEGLLVGPHGDIVVLVMRHIVGLGSVSDIAITVCWMVARAITDRHRTQAMWVPVVTSGHITRLVQLLSMAWSSLGPMELERIAEQTLHACDMRRPVAIDECDRALIHEIVIHVAATYVEKYGEGCMADKLRWGLQQHKQLGNLFKTELGNRVRAIRLVRERIRKGANVLAPGGAQSYERNSIQRLAHQQARVESDAAYVRQMAAHQAGQLVPIRPSPSYAPLPLPPSLRMYKRILERLPHDLSAKIIRTIVGVDHEEDQLVDSFAGISMRQAFDEALRDHPGPGADTPGPPNKRKPADQGTRQKRGARDESESSDESSDEDDEPIRRMQDD